MVVTPMAVVEEGVICGDGGGGVVATVGGGGSVFIVFIVIQSGNCFHIYVLHVSSINGNLNHPLEKIRHFSNAVCNYMSIIKVLLRLF